MTENVKSIKKNYIYNVLYQIITMLAPLITTPYISRVLKAEGIGSYSFVNSIAQYFALFGVMGISTYGQREISYYQHDKKKRSQIFWNAKTLEIITTLFFFTAYILLSLHQSNKALYLALSFNILLCTVDITWFFQGMEEFGIITLRNTIIKVLGIICIFLFVKQEGDLIKYALILSLCGFISNISLWLPARKLLNKPVFQDINPFYNIRIIISLFIPCIAMEVFSMLDKTMIGLICKTASENGHYEQASKIARMVLVIVTALGTVMIPRIGFHFEKGDKEIVKSYMKRAYKFVWFLATPLCVGLIGISSNFVPWFFGTGYEKVIPILSILSFLIIAIGIDNVTGMQYLIPTKRQNLFTKSVIIGAVVNFVLNSYLIYFYGAIGAAIASIIAEFSVALYQIYSVRGEINIKFVFTCGWKNYVASIIMFALLNVLSQNLCPSVINTLILIIFGVCVYIVVLIAFKDEFFLSNILNIWGKIIKHKE